MYIPEGWKIAETRLAIGGIRLTNLDNTISGQFPFHANHDPPIKKYTYIIDFNEWKADPYQFYVAAHAVLVPSDSMEHGWKGGSDAYPSCLEWATYFNYFLNEDESDDNSPEGGG